MKKRALVFCLVFAAFLTGCAPGYAEPQEAAPTDQSGEQGQIKENPQDDTETDAPKTDLDEETIETKPISDAKGDLTAIEGSATKNEETQLYVNERLGFTLEIPKSWEGHYEIEEYGHADYISALFIGESDIAKKFKIDLQLFFIGTEKALKNLIILKKLSMINGTQFYYGGRSDYPKGAFISPLEDDYELYNEPLSESEKQKVKNDLETYSKMELEFEQVADSIKPLISK